MFVKNETKGKIDMSDCKDGGDSGCIIILLIIILFVVCNNNTQKSKVAEKEKTEQMEK